MNDYIEATLNFIVYTNVTSNNLIQYNDIFLSQMQIWNIFKLFKLTLSV